MPKRSHKWKELRSSVPPAQRAFVLWLRELREVSDRTQAQIAEDVYLAPTSLSNHFNGGRIPEAEHVKKLYKILRDEAATSSRPMPCSLPFLLELREKALEKHCGCCPVGSPEAADSSPAPQPTSAGSPAPKLARRRPRRPRVRLSVRRHSIPRAPARAVGLEEAADQVITNAARRDAQAVLNIASALHNSEQYTDAGLLLTAAAQEEPA
ncbi:helix-turn-helix transcriptional regulator [Streptomyces sp. EN16]|uniref:helix-turn-helix domain-containing protein n=1 Tax=Streptomyces sp. EN16 TaxID=212773 RepID=UPI000851D787|nr:helix-turn-helix transcriptional regulator [Streptomyces sp. EN16]